MEASRKTTFRVQKPSTKIGLEKYLLEKHKDACSKRVGGNCHLEVNTTRHVTRNGDVDFVTVSCSDSRRSCANKAGKLATAIEVAGQKMPLSTEPTGLIHEAFVTVNRANPNNNKGFVKAGIIAAFDHGRGLCPNSKEINFGDKGCGLMLVTVKDGLTATIGASCGKDRDNCQQICDGIVGEAKVAIRSKSLLE